MIDIDQALGNAAAIVQVTVAAAALVRALWRLMNKQRKQRTSTDATEKDYE